MDSIEITGTWVPQACTLPSREQPLRVAEFDALFATSLIGLERPEPTRARLALSADAEERARDLAARETGCCSFFTFSFDRTPAVGPGGGGAVSMDVAVPEAYVAVLDALVARAEAARPGVA
ncbi:hypothetical protein OG216_44820 [Streptomycetaceae bacterium NBC_01309]